MADDKKIKFSKEEINNAKEFTNAFRNVNDEVNALFSSLNSVSNEIKGQVQGYQLANKAVNNLTGIFGKVKDIQENIKTANSKDLKTLQEKALAEKKNLIESQRLLLEKNDLVGLTEKEVATLANVNGLLEEQEGLYQSIDATLNQIVINEKIVEKTMGNLGTLTEGFSKGLQKAGLGALDTRLGLGDALQKTKDMVVASEGNVTNLQASKFLAKELGNNLFKALDPATLITAAIVKLVEAFKLVDNSAGDTAKKFNMSYKEASAVNSQLNDMANSSMDISLNTERLRKSMVAVGSALGSNAVLNEKDLTTFTKLTEQAGYQADELMEIQKLSLSQGKSLEDNTKEILGGAKAYAAQNKLVVNEKEVLKEVNKAGAAIKLSLKGSADELARSVVQAKQFGLNLQQADQIASSLLDFESSISNELDAELLTGKNLNLEKARELALNNDIAGAAAEVAKQVGSAEQFGKMNRLQQEAIAKSVGLQREELAQSLIDKEALTKLSAKEGETSQQAFNRLVKEVGMEEAKKRLGNDQLANQFKQQSLQERFAQQQEKIMDLFVSIMEPVAAILDPLMTIVDKVLPLMNVLLTPIFDTFKGISGILTGSIESLDTWQKWLGGIAITVGTFYVTMKGIKAAQEGIVALKEIENGLSLKGIAISLREKAISFGTAIVDIVKGAWTSFGPIPFVGAALAAAAAAAGIAYLSSQSQKMGDVISPADGKTQISTKEGGLFELSKNDDLLAGPGLASKKGGGGGASIDMGPMIERLSAVESVLIQILHKEGTITLNGTKMGTAMAVGSYKIQ
jgi:hypothetical protein